MLDLDHLDAVSTPLAPPAYPALEQMVRGTTFVAALVGLSPCRLESLFRRGLAPVVEITRGRYRWDVGEVAELVQEYRRAGVRLDGPISEDM